MGLTAFVPLAPVPPLGGPPPPEFELLEEVFRRFCATGLLLLAPPARLGPSGRPTLSQRMAAPKLGSPMSCMSRLRYRRGSTPPRRKPSVLTSGWLPLRVISRPTLTISTRA